MILKTSLSDFDKWETPQDLDVLLTNTLLNLGIRINLRGFIYLHDIIYNAALGEDIWRRLTIDIYHKTANKYNTTEKGVERCIRHAICAAFRKMGAKHIAQYLDVPISEYRVATNSEFIKLLVEEMRRRRVVE